VLLRLFFFGSDMGDAEFASDCTLASKGNPFRSVLCKIAHEFKDDLNDDSVRNC